MTIYAPPGGGTTVTSFNTRTGAVLPATADYTAAQVTNAADKSSASAQDFTGEISAPDLEANGLTGAANPTRIVGATATGAPASGTFELGDLAVTQNGHVFVCTVAGTPGTWVDVGSVANTVTSVFTRTGAVTASSGDYTAAQVTNAADKNSGSQQNFTGEVKSPDFVAAGLTGAVAASRYAGATASGAPASGTFAKGDFIIDQTGVLWICTTAGTPGTWTEGVVSLTAGTGISVSAATGAVTVSVTSSVALVQENTDTVTLPAGGTQAVPDVTTDTLHNYTFGAGNVTFTFPTAAAGKSFTIGLKQDGTGSRTATWPGTVDWGAAGAPTLSTGANKRDLISFVCIDGTNWLGTYSLGFSH